MIVTVTTLTGQMFPVEVAEDLELENFKAICEAESGYPATEMAILVTLFPKPLSPNTGDVVGINFLPVLTSKQHIKFITGPTWLTFSGLIRSLANDTCRIFNNWQLRFKCTSKSSIKS